MSGRKDVDKELLNSGCIEVSGSSLEKTISLCRMIDTFHVNIFESFKSEGL